MSCVFRHRIGIYPALLLLGSLTLTAGLVAAEEDVAYANLESVAMTDVPKPRSSELRDALAHAVIERNVITDQRDSLLSQRWLIIGYAAFASLLAAWFIRSSLSKNTPSATGRIDDARTNTTRKHTNATITIRNATTQQAEFTDRVATRRLFKERPAADATTRVMTTSAAATKTPAIPVPVIRKNPALAPIAPAAAPTSVMKPMSFPVARPPARADTNDYPPSEITPTRTLIGTQPSILLAPEIDDSVPETTQVRIARREGRELARNGLSLLEVMIALSILATVLASVGGGIFALNSAKRSANEETVISDVMRLWSERIIGADWEWLGRDRLDDPLRGAWSWQRSEVEGPLLKGDHPPMQEGVQDQTNNAAVQILGTDHSGVKDLRLYLEYYQPIALELCFTPADGTAAHATWENIRNAYRLTPPIDLRQQVDAVVVRLSATWSSQDGGKRRRNLVFARTK